jgi:hypothetical protein
MKSARVALAAALVIVALTASPVSAVPVSGTPGAHSSGGLVCNYFNDEVGVGMPGVQPNAAGQLIWAKTFLMWWNAGANRWEWVSDGQGGYLQSGWAFYSAPHGEWYGYGSNLRAFQHTFPGQVPNVDYAPVTYIWWVTGSQVTGLAYTLAANPICRLT